MQWLRKEKGAEEQADRLDHMLDHVNEFAGFGYEIVLMRLAEVARRLNAPAAVKYHRLVEEKRV